MAERFDLYSMTEQEICSLCESLGEKSFRGKQVFSWLYSGAKSFEDMTNLSKAFRNVLEENCTMDLPQIARKQVSVDGTVKYAFRLFDGEVIESVVMSYHHGTTICLSTQAGCNMGCRFCASAVGGKSRDLSAGEIMGQILVAQQDLEKRIGNIVFMGMGEPLDNLEQVLKFMEIATSDKGLNIGYRHFTLSTCGLCDKIILLAEKKLPINLAVSVHSPFDSERSEMMPVNKKYPLNKLVSALRAYQAATGRRITVEYALNRGANDSVDHAKELMRLFDGLLYHVNVIPINNAREGFYKSGRDAVKKFVDYLTDSGVSATVRRELGADISAACGQLKHEIEKQKTE
ncbi:MAG: 23S rRNA (adenine(2503)-C(2))-methyltransferase RlmN [Ruminococcaceae bacterium]|nr:23S rRNA (adenine(2503)-C(2))-methyltransferase RlmN [Oscillospiraceae bacterium]